MSKELDLPFESNQTPQELDLGHAHFAGGVVVMASFMEAPEGKLPTLVYRFAKADGTGFYPPMIVVVDEDQLTKLAQLTASAVAAAIKAVS